MRFFQSFLKNIFFSCCSNLHLCQLRFSAVAVVDSVTGGDYQAKDKPHRINSIKYMTQIKIALSFPKHRVYIRDVHRAADEVIHSATPNHYGEPCVLNRGHVS